MRECRRNQVNMYYALLDKEVIEYKLDKDGNKIVDYTDVSGKVFYREKGRKLVYSTPVPFRASISYGGNNTEALPYGISTVDYDATIIKAGLPITETSLIWVTSDISYEDEEETIPNSKSADYTVAKITPSLHTTKYELKAIVKG